MEDFKKSWRFNIAREKAEEEFDYITFKESNGEWAVSGYSFIETANPATYGGYGGYTISFTDFIRTKPEFLPIDIYEEMKAIIFKFLKPGPPN